MKVALYIPCYNSEETIKACLDGVLNQAYPIDEILVIDDCSTDRTAKIVNKYPVRVIQHDKNMGLAAARNSALKHTKSELIASLDSDCKPDKEWLRYLVKAIHSSKTAGVGGRVIEARTSGIFNSWRSIHMQQHWGESKKNNPDFLFGSNTLFRRDALEKAGYYDEAYGNNYEDVDISYRLKKSGYSLTYQPKAFAYHLRDDDIQTLLNNFWKWNFNYYKKEGFYANLKNFRFKIKDNIGLANRYIEEDMLSGRYQLIYLDFLLAIHHSLRDFEHFISPVHQSGRKEESVNLALWLSMLDLTFFQHLNSGRKKVSSLISKRYAFMQNFFALDLILGKFIRTYFPRSNLPRILYRHLLLSVYRIDNHYLLDRLLNLVELHENWEKLLEQKHPTLQQLFLKELFLNWGRWVKNTIICRPKVFRALLISAEKTERLCFADGRIT